MEDNKNVKEGEDLLPKAPGHTDESGNEFTGIDMLISTPESMNDLRIRLDEARKNEAEIMRRANEAHEEVCKLERLIKYFESKPIANDNGIGNQNSVVEDNVGSASCASGHAQRVTGSEKQVYNEPVLSEDIDEDYYKKRRLKFWIYVVVVGILLAVISIWVYRYVSDDSEECIEVIYGEGTIKDESLENEVIAADSLNKGSVQSSGTDRDKQKDKAVEPVKDKAKDVNRSKEEKKTDVSKSMVKETVSSTYTIQKGETLFGISKKFYGTIDSVNAIIRVNNLKNPNAITYGTTIKLP
ncbi:MAG: LysM peptidoglycan-binding domain-containing protein [Bacteroidaceae bacterium]|nr:LysM peptidoglycan-binding domain-containing protein [Bacteroidaceae bacterium]